MATIIGLCGSLRTGSYNMMLLRALVEATPAPSRIEVEPIAAVPLYDGDLESSQGIPEPVRALKDRIAAADGLLIVAPEYNNSIPGVAKNAIDWLTRPAKDIDRVFRGRPVAIAGATPGLGGTRLAQAAWLPILRTLGTRPWFERQLHVAGARTVFSEDGRMVDEAMRRRVREFAEGFAAFCDRMRHPAS